MEYCTDNVMLTEVLFVDGWNDITTGFLPPASTLDYICICIIANC